MLKDLLKGKSRDITPKGRACCLDNMGGGVFDAAFRGLCNLGRYELISGDYAQLAAKIDAKKPIIAVLLMDYATKEEDVGRDTNLYFPRVEREEGGSVRFYESSVGENVFLHADNSVTGYSVD